MWSTAKWRTAITAEFRLEADDERDGEEDVSAAGRGRTAAAVVVVGVVVVLAVLPAVIGFGLAPGPVRQVAVGLTGLAAVVGGVKGTAAIWGLAARLAAGQQSQIAAASID